MTEGRGQFQVIADFFSQGPFASGQKPVVILLIIEMRQ
jgi:hypothetical protein